VRVIAEIAIQGLSYSAQENMEADNRRSIRLYNGCWAEIYDDDGQSGSRPWAQNEDS